MELAVIAALLGFAVPLSLEFFIDRRTIQDKLHLVPVSGFLLSFLFGDSLLNNLIGGAAGIVGTVVYVMLFRVKKRN